MIKIPDSSQKELEKLLEVREKIETFQNDYNLNIYLENINLKSIKNRNLYVIFSNLKNNMLFKYSSSAIKRNIKNILLNGHSLKILEEGDVFKLYLYLYENDLENEKIQKIIDNYSKNNIVISKETFEEFVLKESVNLYTKWNFPIEIKIEYKIYEDIVKRLENPDVLKKISPIILELARYIDMNSLSKEIRESVKKEMYEKLPHETKSFFKKYNKINFQKIERIDNIIFIFLKRNNVISLKTKRDRNIKIEYLPKARYDRIIAGEINTSDERLKERVSVNEVKSYKELAKKLRMEGYPIKWIEIDTIPKVIGITFSAITLIGGLTALGYYIWNL